MFRLVKVQEPVNREFVYKILEIPEAVYSVKPKYSPTGKILNPKEYYGSRKITTVQKKLSYPVENEEYFRIKNDYITMINKFRENMADQFIGGMPVQMEKGCIKQLFRTTISNTLAYSVTLKVDGERFLMMVGLDSQVVFIDRSTNIFYLINSFNERARFPGIKAPFLLDGELVQHPNGEYEYLVFDVLFYPNQANVLTTYMYSNYEYRYLVAHECVTLINKYTFNGFNVSLKQWFPITDILITKNFYKYIADATNDYRAKRKIPLLKADGLIFQPNDGPYIPFREWNGYNNVQFKWKPPEELTIDFKILVTGKRWILLTKTDQQFMVNQPNVGGKKIDPVPAMCEPTEDEFKMYQNGEVVEFKFQAGNNPQRNLFIPVRSRKEKSANSYATIMSTLSVINNPFYMDSLRECFEIILSDKISTKQGMKTFMNTVFNKSDLILFASYPNRSFFNKKETDAIKNIYENILKRDSPNYELEFRILSYNKTKKSVLTKSTFFYILDYLWQNFPMENYESIDVLLNQTGNKNKYRSTYVNMNDIYRLNSIQNMEKRSVGSYLSEPSDPNEKLYNNLTFKIDLSIEEHIADKFGITSQVDDRKVTNMFRKKSRKTFKINDLWQIDLTRVKTSFFLKDLLEKNETFECEIEFIGPGSQYNPDAQPLPFEDFFDSINRLYMLILSNSGYC
jgi:hypothetical protein